VDGNWVWDWGWRREVVEQEQILLSNLLVELESVSLHVDKEDL
jgi:hypothetical protein